MFLPTFVISKCCLDFNHIFPKCRDFTREFCCIKHLNPCPLHVCQFVFQLLSPQMFAPFLSCFVVIGSQPWNIWNVGFVGKSETIFCFQRWLGNFQISYDLAPVSQSVISEGRCPQMPISKMSKLFLQMLRIIPFIAAVNRQFRVKCAVNKYFSKPFWYLNISDISLFPFKFDLSCVMDISVTLRAMCVARPSTLPTLQPNREVQNHQSTCLRDRRCRSHGAGI